MADEDDDLEWERAPATVVDSDAITAPHPVVGLPGFEPGRAKGREEGCAACCKKCQDEVFEALEIEFRSRGLAKDEIAHIALAIRQRIAPA